MSRLLLGIVLGLVLILVAIVLLVFPSQPAVINAAMYTPYFNSSPTFEELDVFFEDLALTHGGEAAFNVLITADLQGDADTHLLGHTVGDVLYTQEGLEGLQVCTQDIGFACAHSIVINELLVTGDSVFDRINEICAKAEGPDAYRMCFHGFGHAVLAYAEYEMPDAIELCKKVGTVEHGGVEAEECIGGTIMEMRDGLHNPIVWEQNGTKYLSDEDPFALCEAAYMPRLGKVMCYTYITPFIFDSIDNWDLPTADHSAQAINYCADIAYVPYRSVCYGGFAKEFINFVFGRDVRKIAHATDEELLVMYEQCLLADAALGERDCVRSMARQLYRAGMYHPMLAARFCSVVQVEHQRLCFGTHYTELQISPPRQEDMSVFCDFVNTVYIPLCKNST